MSSSFRNGLLTVMSLFLFLPAFSQISEVVSRVNVSTPRAGEPLTIQAELINPSVIDRVELAYRSFGQSTFKQVDMPMMGNSAAVALPSSELLPPFLEYYLIIHKREGGAQETFPVENATEHPFKVDLQLEGPPDESVIVLSPELHESVPPEELYISFSLLRADSTIDKSKTKTYVDGADISANAVVSGSLVVVRPSITLTPGQHTVLVELFDVTGRSVQKVSWDFTASAPGGSEVAPEQQTWLYNYSLQAETRNEKIMDATTPYNRLTLSGAAKRGQYRFMGNLYLTNEEQSTRQPQNRYFISGETSWLRIGYGDSYPVYPGLVMSGKRVRGIVGNLTTGAFNVDVASGDITRNIESDTIKTFPVDSLAVEQARDSSASYGLYDASTNRWAKFSYGTYSRNLLVVRPSFGPRDGSHFGLTFLKSSDDTNSIKFGNRPKENLLVGSDLDLYFDRRKIEISAQVAMSATNNDITGGTFTDAAIDSIYANENEGRRNNIKKIKDILGRFITVNQNLIPLNMANLPTLAYEGALSLNYADNYFKLSYMRHGNNFESFGQSFVRPDINGVNVSDRLRLAQGQVILSGGYERLQDNTANTKPATTTFTTGNFSVGYFPRVDIPNITVAYVLASSDNNMQRDSLYGIDDRSNRVFVQLGKQFLLGPKHNATLGVSTSTRDDATSRNLDTKNTGVSLADEMSFTDAVHGMVSISSVMNSFRIVPGGGSDTSINYSTLYAGVRARLVEDRLILNAAVSPTFGDIERTLLDGRAQYYFVKNMSLSAQATFYLNKKTTNDILWSLILRADM